MGKETIISGFPTIFTSFIVELLQKNNLPYSGKKEDLIDRLVKNDEREALENLEKEFELDDDLDDSKINL
jgi:SAP domain-containing ribonucleoprotein